MGPGESFGELALLQKKAKRTATVAAAAAATAAALQGASSSVAAVGVEAAASAEAAASVAACIAAAGGHAGISPACASGEGTALDTAAAPEPSCAAPSGGGRSSSSGGSSSGGLDLIRISRACYDSAASYLLVAELEALLAFLASCEPLAGLSRELLTALAVLARPVRAAAGELVAAAGAPVEALALVQVRRGGEKLVW